MVLVSQALSENQRKDEMGKEASIIKTFKPCVVISFWLMDGASPVRCLGEGPRNSIAILTVRCPYSQTHCIIYKHKFWALHKGLLITKLRLIVEYIGRNAPQLNYYKCP